MRGLRPHMNLIELAHLADVDQGGLYIDFGTPSRMKYTSGIWNSGWGADRITDGETVSRFGERARIYFPVWEVGALTLHLRIKSAGSEQLIAFMNGNNVGEPRVERGEFRDIVIEVPAERVRRGENYLLIRSTETQELDGAPTSFEVASLWVRPAGAQGNARPAAFAAQTEVGGQARQGVALSAPGSASWFVEVPTESPTLVFTHGHTGEGSAEVSVSAHPEGGETVELQTFDVGDSWTSTRVDLAAVAGKITRLEVKVTGQGTVAFSDVVVAVPAVDLGALPQARNVVVLTVDTLRASKLKPYNRRSRVRTPALDSFAEASTLFERSQTSENWTKPAVASILTSLFPATHGAKNDASRLPQTVTTLGEVYQGAGFETASFLANGHVSRAFGFDQGWDHYTNYIRENRSTEAENVFGEAADWIEEHKDERFFVYIQTIDPHVPYDPPDDYLRMYDARTDYSGQVSNRSTGNLLGEAKKTPPGVVFTESDVQRLEALHDGEISYHDEHFGQFLAKLHEWGLDENTVFVFTSDHGEEFNEHGSWGHGHSIFQELLAVPLMFRWPGVATANGRIPQAVSTMDIGPTILEATGVEIPSEFEGRSLMPYLRGSTAPGPAVAFSDFQENRRVIRAADWKLVLRSSLTYVLFDLASDPNERNELDGRRNPIAMRYLRIMSGQFLGARNRTRWLEGTADAVREHVREETMTEELCRQLVALGYMECLGQFPGAGG